jgi:hypothetical protein
MNLTVMIYLAFQGVCEFEVPGITLHTWMWAQLTRHERSSYALGASI